MANDNTNASLGLDPIVAEAIDRFQRCLDWERQARKYFMDDLRFCEGDAYNGFQWPGGVRQDRELESKPCLTINKTRQHCLQIINDAKQNKAAIKVSATGGGATYQSAQILGALIKHIEYRSNASVAYDKALEYQVKGGWGYIGVKTQYMNSAGKTDQDLFNQEILIRLIQDPLMIYMDPDAKEPDKSDARFAFECDLCPKDEFDRKYPRYKAYSGQSVLGENPGWLDKQHIMVAEYWRRVTTKDRVYAIATENGMAYIRKSQMKGRSKEEIDDIENDPSVMKRDVEDTKVEWRLIVGEKIVETKQWNGKYIPLVPVVGEETIIDGTMDRKGHVRALLDPQRMYNWWSSFSVEAGASQGKTPWMCPVESIEGYENYYSSANRVNHAWLPYKSRDQAGQELPAPQKIPPAVAAPVALTGMQVASMEFGLVSGQYEPQMGQQGNERTGEAISQRQRQGDNATYHYQDGLAIAIRQVGKIVLDLIPHIYDTQRVMQILSLEEQPIELVVDPNMKQAYEQRKNQEGIVVQHALNPAVGTYEVQADVGPGYATQREEAFEAYKLILTQSPQLTQFLGDILFRAANFPHADEAASRLRKMVPPYALGEGPSPAEQQLQYQLQQMTSLLQGAMTEVTDLKSKLRQKDERRDTDIYNAFTTRLRALLEAKIKAAQAAGGDSRGAQLDMGELSDALGDLLPDVLGMDINPIAQGHEQQRQMDQLNLPMQMPHMNAMPGTHTGMDGREYMRDYSHSQAFRPI